MTENMAKTFLPDTTKIRLGDDDYRLVYDMTAFCALEAIYGTVDTVLKMLFGDVAQKLEPVVTYNDAPVSINEIVVDGTPLEVILNERNSGIRTAKHSDTLELIWAGMMHDNAIYNDNDELIGYTMSRREVAGNITFKNYNALNRKIVEAILRDLAPGVGASEEKNVQPEKPIQLVTPE